MADGDLFAQMTQLKLHPFLLSSLQWELKYELFTPQFKFSPSLLDPSGDFLDAKTDIQIDTNLRPMKPYLCLERVVRFMKFLWRLDNSPTPISMCVCYLDPTRHFHPSFPSRSIIPRHVWQAWINNIRTKPQQQQQHGPLPCNHYAFSPLPFLPPITCSERAL